MEIITHWVIAALNTSVHCWASWLVVAIGYFASAHRRYLIMLSRKEKILPTMYPYSLLCLIFGCIALYIAGYTALLVPVALVALLQPIAHIHAALTAQAELMQMGRDMRERLRDKY